MDKARALAPPAGWGAAPDPGRGAAPAPRQRGDPLDPAAWVIGERITSFIVAVTNWGEKQKQPMKVKTVRSARAFRSRAGVRTGPGARSDGTGSICR